MSRYKLKDYLMKGDKNIEIEYQQSEEHIKENIELNEYEFYADGRVY